MNDQAPQIEDLIRERDADETGVGRAGRDQAASADFRSLPTFGRSLLAEGRADEARAIFRRVLACDPGDAGATRMLAQAERRLGNDDVAAKLLQAVVDADPTNLPVLIELAALMRDAQRTAGAASIYGQVLAIDRDFVQAHLGLAWISQANGDLQRARTHFASAVTSLRNAGGNGRQPRLQLAAALTGLGDVDAAAAIYDAILDDDAGDVAARIGLGWVARARGDGEGAVAQVRIATAAHPADPQAQMALARLLVLADRPDEAGAIYLDLARRLPQRSDILGALGALARQRADWAAAREHFEAALRLSPGAIPFAIDLAHSCRELDDWDSAERYFLTALTDAPGHVEALLGLGEIAKARGETGRALSLFTEAAAAAPLDFRPKREIRRLKIANSAYDWRTEIEDAAAVARSGNASLADQIEAAKILVEYGLTSIATPLLMQIESRSKAARMLLLAVRQIERMGLQQPLPTGAGDPDAETDQLESLRGIIEKPCAGSDTLLIVFGGTNNRLWMTFSLLHRILKPVGVSIVYARDLRQNWYLDGVEGLGADFASSAEGFRELAGRYGARRILTLGNCVGCLGALRFGLALGAQGVLGLGPKMRPRSGLERQQRSRLGAIRARSTSDHRNVHAQYLAAAARPNVTLIHGEHCARDAADAGLMADVPGTTSIAIPGAEDADCVKDLLVRGLLAPVLQDFVVAGTLTANLRARIAASLAVDDT